MGTWVNIGAGATNSDLKNTYGKVRFQHRGEAMDTALQFLGCIIGDYAKSAINTSIFTGKSIGVACMLYGYVGQNVPSFVNYARSFGQVTEVPDEGIIASQARMFKRRNVTQRPCDIQLLRDMHVITRHERQIANDEPQGVAEIARKLEELGVSRHEVRHEIGQPLASQMWHMLQEGCTFDEERYMAELREIVARKRPQGQ